MRKVGDVECYSNFFSCTFVDYDEGNIDVFEISERRNDLLAFVEFVGTITYFIGFNIVHYDNPIVMYLVKNVNKLKDETWDSITKRVKALSDCIIGDDDGSNYRLYNKYKYPPYVSVDLFLYWSKLTRKSRKLSLKGFAININWPRVQELPIHHTAEVRIDQIDDLLSYNLNDCNVTKALAVKMSKDINLRAAARIRYGFECMSWDGVKLGLNILVKRYCDRTGRDMSDVNRLRTVRPSVRIGECLLPIINFKVADTSSIQFIENKNLVTRFKSFYGLWKYLENLEVTNAKSINCQVMLDGNRYDIKSGGLHTFHNPGIVIPGPDELYEDDDVGSYYPTMGAMWQFVPEHLGPEFAEELDSVRGERMDLKRDGLGKSTDAELLKLSMNGGYFGNTNNEYTPMQDLKAFLSITMNGQLLLLMLAERLMDIGVKVDMCNTDGITIRYHKSLYDRVREICREWEVLARVELESVKYLKVIRKDINNYLAIYEEKGVTKFKEKGMFLTDPAVDMSRDLLIIPKAIKAYYQSGTPIEETVYNSRDIYDFCASMKVDKSYSVFWQGIEQQRLNRYFITKGGAYLYKSRDGKNMEHMMKGNTVQLFNNYYDVPFEEYNINYNYYIAEIKGILNELQPSQLSLI